MIFPQFANGGVFRSTLILQNTTGATVTGQVEFFRPNGTPFSLSFSDGQSGANRNFELGANRSLFLETTGSGDLSVGWVRVTSNNSIGGTVVFSQFDADGRRVTEAGVNAATAATELSIPVDARQAPGFNTGLAIVNAGIDPASITLRLLDTNGAILGMANLPPLAGRNHMARFVTELFPSATIAQGTLSIISSLPVAAVVLRTAPGVLTTLPVNPGAAGAPVTPKLGSYRGTTAQGLPIYLGTFTRGQDLLVTYEMLTRLDCMTRPAVFDNYPPSTTGFPVNANGEFTITAISPSGVELVNVTGKFVSSTKAIGTVRSAGVSDPGTGSCDQLSVSWEATFVPDAPTLSGLNTNLTPALTRLQITYSGSAPRGDVIQLIIRFTDAQGGIVWSLPTSGSLPGLLASDAGGYFTFTRTVGINFTGLFPTAIAGVYLILVDSQGNRSVPMTAMIQRSGAKPLAERADPETVSPDGIIFERIGSDRLTEPINR
jgi:hypothetical protein